jgi:hypothetical protein
VAGHDQIGEPEPGRTGESEGAPVIRWQVSDGHRTVSHRGVAATRERAWTDAATCAAMIAADPLDEDVLSWLSASKPPGSTPRGRQHERATTERVAADLADAMRGVLMPPT